MSQRVGTVKALRLPRHADSDRVGRRAAASLGVLGNAGYVGAEAVATAGENFLLRGRVGMQRAARLGMRLGFVVGRRGFGGFCPFDGGTLEWTASSTVTPDSLRGKNA